MHLHAWNAIFTTSVGAIFTELKNNMAILFVHNLILQKNKGSYVLVLLNITYPFFVTFFNLSLYIHIYSCFQDDRSCVTIASHPAVGAVFHTVCVFFFLVRFSCSRRRQRVAVTLVRSQFNFSLSMLWLVKRDAFVACGLQKGKC